VTDFREFITMPEAAEQVRVMLTKTRSVSLGAEIQALRRFKQAKK